MKKGFTLLELIVVIVILGILATLGFTQYTKVVERGRTAEAKAILGQLRAAQMAYKLTYGDYSTATTPADLGINAPTSCTNTHYFWYRAYNVAASKCGGEVYAYATRCTAGGKLPDVSSQYLVRICFDTGTWDIDSGY
ncbi:MAG: prepilin-type N-terminal cleavage/methylation domain-containing protein [Candidatus Omnitrophica bacterium]|nr:prepilin-type N-terminal cleavage/methylation domain-containing protein [Candidatus Omnitrophota bacterium]